MRTSPRPDLLSAELCSEKMWGPSTGAADPIFPGEKNWSTFFAHHSVITRGSPNYPACKNLPLLLWGLFFVGAPVRPNMLNIPKSAAAHHYLIDNATCRLATQHGALFQRGRCWLN